MKSRACSPPTPARLGALSVFFLAATVVSSGVPATAQDVASAQQASYTRAQAEAGATVYRQACSECHLANLRGSFEAPELSGPSFRASWRAGTVAGLLDVIRETMPPDAPRTLSEQQAAAVAAYLLRENGVSAADTPLSLSSSGQAFTAEGISATGATSATRPPVPGRIGTAPSPEAVNAAPEVGTVSETPTGHTRTHGVPSRFTPVSDSDLADPPRGDWLQWRGGPGAQGYSALDQIDRQNVDRLQLAWVWGMEPGTSQSSFLVRDGVVFLPSQANVIQALDGRDGTLLWQYRRKFAEGTSIGRGHLRSLAIWEDLVLVATLDAYLVALDARTGIVRWETQVADHDLGFAYSSGPVVADGKVITGIGGCTRL